MPEESDNKVENINKELSGVVQVQSKAAAKAKKRAPRRKTVKQRIIFVKGKRKRAVARARLVKGNGRITVNGFDVRLIKPKEMREMVLEPVNFSPATREIAKESDIKVNVYGGGISGQLQAARTAIAKAIAAASNSDIISKAYMKYDRTLLVSDVRQVEPKKFKGPKARARFQKSYR